MDSALLQSATVAEAMQPFDTVTPDTSLVAAAALMKSHHGRALVVEAGEESPSIFTEYDIIKVVAQGDQALDDKTVGDYRTRVAITATPDWSLGRAVDTMLHGQFRHLVVVEDGRTVGLLAMRDVLDLMMEESDRVSPTPADDTVEFGVGVEAGASHLIHNIRRGAKQHMAALQCPCELDWVEILIGQVEERPGLSRDEIQELWDMRQPCPTLHAEGGGAD